MAVYTIVAAYKSEAYVYILQEYRLLNLMIKNIYKNR